MQDNRSGCVRGVELLIDGALADAIRRDSANRSDSFIVPHLLDVEVMSALRSLVAGQRVDAHRSEQLLAAPAFCAKATTRGSSYSPASASA